MMSTKCKSATHTQERPKSSLKAVCWLHGAGAATTETDTVELCPTCAMTISKVGVTEWKIPCKASERMYFTDLLD